MPKIYYQIFSWHSPTSAQQNSFQRMTFEPDQTDEEKRPSVGDGVNDASVELAKDGTQVDQNDEQNQDTRMEYNDLLVDTENNSSITVCMYLGTLIT